jgi:hypothetical protein
MYCPKATETTSSFATNVGARCIAANKKYNTCFNKVQRDAANTKRKAHGAVPLQDDSTTGEALQGKLEALTGANWKAGEVDLPNTSAAVTALDLPTGC